MLTSRYYLHPSGRDQEMYQTACNFAGNFVNKEFRIKHVAVLYRDEKKALESERIWGRDRLQDLRQDMWLRESDPLFSVMSMRAYLKGLLIPDALIAFGFDTADMFKIEQRSPSCILIAVPEQLHDIEEWIKTWDPREITGAPSVVPAHPLPPCVMRVGIDEMMEDKQL